MKAEKTLVVFDCDGTITDAWAESPPFVEGYRRSVADLLSISVDQIATAAERLERAARRYPHLHGWRPGGEHIVAPACVDPLVRESIVAMGLLTSVGGERFADPEVRWETLGAFYTEHYPNMLQIFRPGAFGLFQQLNQQAPSVMETCVVTNSGTSHVMEKVGVLAIQHGKAGELDWLKARVFGGARKFELNGRFRSVPSAVWIKGLLRPIFLRRGHYINVLNGLRRAHSVKWRNVWVVGDIAEMDLFPVHALGGNVILMTTEHTPRYEVRHFRRTERCHVIESLEEVPRIIGL